MTAQRTVLAAVATDPAARAVLETAGAIAELMGADVDAVHVGHSSETLGSLAARHDTPLRLLPPPTDAALLRAVAAPAVVAAVVGARATPGGRRPAGRTALALVERTSKPTVVVPPDAAGAARPVRRLLVPLEGREESSRPVVDRLVPLVVRDVELVVLHVFTPDTAPRVLDRPGRDLALLGDEFLTRHCPYASRIEWCTGPVGAGVTEAYDRDDADLVVLSWSQDRSVGHARVVHDVLAASTIPVLLLPVAAARDLPA